MSWQAYRLVYEAKAPVHIGWNTLGYVNRTRHYIPGKNIWAAYTACLTRAIGDKGTADYGEIGEKLIKCMIPSYFFPSLKKDGSYYSLLPEYGDTGLQYRVCPAIKTWDDVEPWPAERFERTFISSFAQTAVVPESETAHDGSLHESEFITPKVLIGEQQSVYFIGYVFFKEGMRIKNQTAGWDSGEICMKNYVSEIFVGGDRKYGWGRLVLTPDDQAAPDNFFGFDLDLETSSDSPIIKLANSKPIPAHLPVQSGGGFKGDIEPLVGRDWAKDDNGNHGAGQHLSDASTCWVPGSLWVHDSKEEPRDLFLIKHGLLEIRTG